MMVYSLIGQRDEPDTAETTLNHTLDSIRNVHNKDGLLKQKQAPTTQPLRHEPASKTHEIREFSIEQSSQSFKPKQPVHGIKAHDSTAKLNGKQDTEKIDAKSPFALINTKESTNIQSARLALFGSGAPPKPDPHLQAPEPALPSWLHPKPTPANTAATSAHSMLTKRPPSPVPTKLVAKFSSLHKLRQIKASLKVIELISAPGGLKRSVSLELADFGQGVLGGLRGANSSQEF